MKSLKIAIEIPEGKKAEWVNNVLTLVDIKPETIMDKIKTFKDAYDYLDKDDLMIKDLNDTNYGRVSSALLSYLKLRIIARALNENWTPKFTKDEKRWFPVFNLKYNSAAGDSAGIGFFYSNYGTGTAHSSVGFDLLFKSKELSDYCVEQFKDLWSLYLINK